MNEEEIIKKAISEIEYYTKEIKDFKDCKTVVNDCRQTIDMIQGLLDLYNKEKEKNKELKEELNRQINTRIMSEEFIEKNFISKDKIKEILDTYRYTKIEETGKIIEFNRKIEGLVEEE